MKNKNELRVFRMKKIYRYLFVSPFPYFSVSIMLTRNLAGFSTYFMQGVLSFLSYYEAVSVGYTCRDGKESLDIFRETVYNLYVHERLLPSPDYTVANFYSMFCDCACCGTRPRISLYSWKFLPKSQGDIEIYDESLPPVFDKKCKECTIEDLYNWFYMEKNRVCIHNPIGYLENENSDDNVTCFRVIRWTVHKVYEPANTGFPLCKLCKKKVIPDDRVVGVIHDLADTYHIECFFDRFAIWSYYPDCTLPAIEVV